MKNLLILLTATIFLILLSCEKTKLPIVLKKTVKYRVAGVSRNYWIQYNDEAGKYVQIRVNSNWEYEFKARPDKYLYLSCRNNTNSGYVSVEILLNGKVFLSDETILPYGVAVTSGYVK